MLEEGEATPPSLWEHTITVFNEMRKRSVEQVGDGGIKMIVYEGFTTGLFSELGMSIPYYTKIMRRLKAMGCVRQLKRGGGAAPSRWEILCEPEFDDFMAADREVDDRAPAVSRASIQDQQIADVNDRLLSLEEWRDKMMEALVKGGNIGQLG